MNTSRIAGIVAFAATLGLQRRPTPPTRSPRSRTPGRSRSARAIHRRRWPIRWGDGKYVGYHVDVCLKIADAIKAQLKMPNLPVEYTVVTSANRVPLVQNGTVDMECGSTTNNAARASRWRSRRPRS